MALKKCAIWLILACMMLSLMSCGEKPASSSNNSTVSAVASDEMTESGMGSEENGSTNESTVSTGSSVTTNNSNQSTNSKPNTNTSTNTSSKKTAEGNGEISKNVLVKNGTKKMEEGLNFSGKTFTMACGIAPTNQVKRHIAAFQKKYNCTIKTDVLDFNQYTQQVVSKIASGGTYDLLQLEGSRYPTMVLANTCEPIEDIITTADWLNKSKLDEGGFSEELSMAFAWDNHLYGVLGIRGMYAPSPNLVWYNKKILKQAGTDDPRELYESGKWTFDALRQIGLDVKKSVKIPLGGIFMLYGNIVPANGGWYVKYNENGTKPVSNLTDSRIANAYKFMQQLTVGNNAVIEVSASYDCKAFLQGKSAMWVGAPYHLSANNEIAKKVEDSNAFGKSLTNLGVTPMPMGPDNKEKAYGVGWLYSFAAGKGTSDKRVAVAWAKFATTYKDPIKDEYTWSAADQKMIDSLTSGNMIYRNYAFADGSNSIYELVRKMEYEISVGKDISQEVTTYNVMFKNCINVSLKG